MADEIKEIDLLTKAIPEYSKDEIKSVIDKAQSTEETKKTWESLDIIKKVEVVRHAIKQSKGEEYEPPEELPKNVKLKSGKERTSIMDNPNNGMVKMFGIAIAVGLIVFVVVSTQFVTNTSFNRSITTMQGTVNEAVKGVNDTKAAMLTQISAIPGTVTQQTSGLSNQITSVNTDLSGKISTINSQLASQQSTLTSGLASVKSEQDTARTTLLNTVNDKLNTISENVSATQASLLATIATLQTQITSLQSQLATTQSLTYISVSGTSTNINSPIPSITISNTGTSTVDLTNISVTLTMTPPSGMTLTANYPITSSSGLINNIFALKATLGQLGGTTIAPNSTINISPNITLTSTLASGYTANSTSPWNAVWSKS